MDQPAVTFTPIYPSLTEPALLGGVEYSLAIANGTAGAAFVMGLQMPWFILLSIAIHILLAHVTRRDPYIRHIYKRYVTQGWVYDPWPRVSEEQQQPRPEGFARCQLC